MGWLVFKAMTKRRRPICAIIRYQHTKMATIVPIMVYVKTILNNIPRLVPILGQYSQIGTNTGTIFPDWYQYWDSIPRLVRHWDSIPRLVPTIGQYSQIGTNTGTVFPDWYRPPSRSIFPIDLFLTLGGLFLV